MGAAAAVIPTLTRDQMLWELAYWELLQLEIIYAARNGVDCVAQAGRKRRKTLWHKIHGERN